LETATTRWVQKT